MNYLYKKKIEYLINTEYKMKRSKAVNDLSVFAEKVKTVPLNYDYPLVELNPLVMRKSIECPIITQPDINSNKFLGIILHSIKLDNVYISPYDHYTTFS
tara:strand:- start:784 stop:1080 length:297 start_codon:yes stop_codon:yes gene_type:complete